MCEASSQTLASVDITKKHTIQLERSIQRERERERERDSSLDPIGMGQGQLQVIQAEHLYPSSSHTIIPGPVQFNYTFNITARSLLPW